MEGVLITVELWGKWLLMRLSGFCLINEIVIYPLYKDL